MKQEAEINMPFIPEYVPYIFFYTRGDKVYFQLQAFSLSFHTVFKEWKIVKRIFELF